MKKMIVISSIFLCLLGGASAQAAVNISKAGDLTAVRFDELGFDPTGLVGYWQLNGNAEDSSGQGNNGTITGATSTTDRFGNTDGAMAFNGTSHYVVATAIPVTGQVPVSLFFWANLRSNATSDDVLVIYGNSGVNGECAGLYARNGVGYIRFTGWSNATKDYDTGFLKDFNVWHHWAIIYDGTNVLIYQDGVADPVGSKARALNFTVGKVSISCPTASTFADEEVDEVKIFNRALSAAEVLAMYEHEKGKFSAGKDGVNRAVSFVEDPTLPVQGRSKKAGMIVKGSLVEDQ